MSPAVAADRGLEIKRKDTARHPRPHLATTDYAVDTGRSIMWSLDSFAGRLAHAWRL
jgi:hypothetical protein